MNMAEWRQTNFPGKCRSTLKFAINLVCSLSQLFTLGSGWINGELWLMEGVAVVKYLLLSFKGRAREEKQLKCVGRTFYGEEKFPKI